MRNQNPVKNMHRIVAMTVANVPLNGVGDAPPQPPHIQPLLIGVYGCGVYRANVNAVLGLNTPPSLTAFNPLSSITASVYVA